MRKTQKTNATLLAVQKEANISAAKKVADLLSNTSDLYRVPQLKQMYIEKKATMEAQLKGNVQSQIDDAKSAMVLLQESNSAVSKIRKDLNDVNSLCMDCQKLITSKHYPLIAEVNKVRNNLAFTLKEIDRLLSIPNKVQRIEDSLKDDINILAAYVEVRNLEKMRDQAFLKAKENTEELKALVFSFQDVNRLIDSFNTKLFSLAERWLELAQKKPTVLVKVVQVIERDRKLDELIAAQMKAQGLDPDDNSHSTLRRFKERLFIHIRDSIIHRFENQFNACKSVQEILEKIQEILDDLTTIMDDVVCCFPPEYEIFNFFAKEYHIRVNNLFIGYVNNPEAIIASDIIGLVGWIQKDYLPQLARIGVTDPQPDLLETVEPLLDHYMAHVTKLMDQWIIQIVQQDKTSEPDIVEGLFVTLAPSLLFESINTQLHIAKDSNYPKFVFYVLKTCGNGLLAFQKAMTAMLKSEWEGLSLEYLEAVINNSSKCYDQVDGLVTKMCHALKAPFDQEIPGLLEPATDGFHNLSMTGVSLLADLIFRDLTDTISKLFQEEWYESKLMKAIILTIEDYFRDIDGRVMESYFRKLGNECFDRLVFHYVEQLFSKKHKLTQDTVKNMQEDEMLIRECFEKYVRKNAVDSKMQVLTDLRELLDSEPENVALYFHSLLKNNPDLTLEFIMLLLSMKFDFGANEVNEAIEECYKIIEQRDKELTDPSKLQEGLFTQLAAQPNLQKLLKGYSSRVPRRKK